LAQNVNSCLQNAAILFFLLFFPKYLLYFIVKLQKGLFMKAKKGRRMPPTDGSIKLSKAALWLLKHPNGLEGKILDMRAVMR
jgi:hypothetical protein